MSFVAVAKIIKFTQFGITERLPAKFYRASRKVSQPATANMNMKIQLFAFFSALIACFIVGAIGGDAARNGRRFK